MKLPLISCLCVSYKRPQYLKRAIECFKGQSYKRKELIILSHPDDVESERLARKAGKGVTYYVAPRVPLGELRNMAIGVSKGEYFCQWDDDDWYHKDRLKEQYNVIQSSKKPACVMAYWVMFDSVAKEAYLSSPAMWAGTIMCNRAVFDSGLRYPGLAKDEDTQLMVKLYKENCLCPMVMPSLYIYVYHGSNTWESTHFKGLFEQSQRLSESTSKVISNILSKKYTYEHASSMMLDPQIMGEFNYFQMWVGNGGNA